MNTSSGGAERGGEETGRTMDKRKVRASGQASAVLVLLVELQEKRAKRRALSLLRLADRFLDRGLLMQAVVRIHAAEVVTDLVLLCGLLPPASPVLTTICEAWLERVVRLATLRNEGRRS